MRDQHHVPVDPPGKPPGSEPRGLDQVGAELGVTDLPLDPRIAGEPHFGVEPQALTRDHILHPPEVHRLADSDLGGMAAPATEADSAHQAVEHPPDPPCPIEAVVARPSPDAAERPVEMVGVGVGGHHLAVHEHGASGPCRVGRHRCCGMGGGVRPAGDHTTRKPAQGATHRDPERGRLERHQILGGGGHHLGAQALHQGPGDLRRQRGHQPDPPRRQLGGEQGYRDQQAAAQTGLLGIDLHHLGVGEHLRSAYVEHPGLGGAILDRSAQHLEDVTHRHRLATGAHPLGGDHHREHLGEGAQHLERERTRTDDHRGPHLGGGGGAGGENPPHLVATVEVAGAGAPLVTQRTQVDDPPQAGILCGGTEVGCGATVEADEFGTRRHGVHQVHGGIAADQGLLDGALIERVPTDHLDPVAPRVEG